MGQQFFLKSRKAEEIRRLLNPFDGCARWRLAVNDFAFGVERLITDSIPSGVGAEINGTIIDQFLPQLLTRRIVTWFRCADEIIIGEVQRSGKVLKFWLTSS